MKQLVELAAELQQLFEELRWEYCFIGGLAVQAWGESRLTLDVDVSLLTRFMDEEHYIDLLLQRFEPRIAQAREFALQNRVLLLRQVDIGIDIGLAGLPFEEQAVSESRLIRLGRGRALRLISADNLIVMKAFAARERDWLDISGIITRQRDKLDQALIFERLTPLVELKEEPWIIDKLRGLFSSKLR